MKYEIRQAKCSDVANVVSAVEELLQELRNQNEPETIAGADRICMEIIEDRHPGAVFVAELNEDGSRLIGVVTATVDSAVSYGDKYVMIQELWVDPDFRSNGIGGKLLEALKKYFRNQSISIFKVCLPPSSYMFCDQTHNFYSSHGFFDLGTYMRKNLDN